jgi:crotonobetainyl-CoA:carnitine CoA-transferase CaiB-like acyl-CoA transferase
MAETPWRISRRAPLIGEHNKEIYQEELGFSREEMLLLKEARII